MPSANDTTDDQEPDDLEFVTTFDPDGEPASEAVVTAVAAVRGSKPAALEPLHAVVDPDALDSLVGHADRVGTAGSHQVWFTYEGFDVAVRTDGEVRLRDATVTAD
ncbi:hypothetical protein NP511_10965 [Natrinema thermotolerans]|uniref:Halobacterial output domain-containing protein n=1 Tax=Natrinema thermotolerans TaxID=121872 RepID=A0AAF0T887_9EURY|nr:HalOD1 output domain-containing protein [Natrinema thermotolerans]QCC58967.1 hypothetical protein DVR14_10105 [Natrinema thermotolerans]WMT10129.1 hypothetical protein NP511_10965 [Natrinema thermotolerans]